MSLVLRIALILSLACGLLFAALFSGQQDSAQAQAPEPARLAVDASGDATSSVATISLDVGTSRIAAVGGTLAFDETMLRADSCELAGSGACNVVDGEVLFAGFEATGFEDTDALLTVNFTPLVPQAAAGVELELEIDTAVVETGSRLGDDLQVESGELSWAEAKGSITGDIKSAGFGEGLFGLEVCVAAEAGPTCTTTSGLGSYLIEGLPSGAYDLVVTDPNDQFGSATLSVDVVSPNITTGADLVLSPADAPVVADEDDVVVGDDPGDDVAPNESDDDADGADGADGVDADGVPVPGAIVGNVVDAATGDSVFGLQVCATMPVVLTQSCSFTNVDGDYTIVDLVAGNYAISVSDPAQRYQDAEGERPAGITADQGAIVDLSVARS